MKGVLGLAILLLLKGNSAAKEDSGLTNSSHLHLNGLTDQNETMTASVNRTSVFDPSSKCGVWDEESISSCSFWMEGVILSITGTFGLVGNTMSIVILTAPDMYNSFNQLLIGLSTLDSIFIVLAIMDYSIVRAFKWSSNIFVYCFPYFIYPLNNLSFCGSIFMTVALAYERYIAVSRPLHYRNVTVTYSVRRRTIGYLIPVLLFSLALSIPKFFESKIVYKSHDNSTMEDDISLGVTDLRSDPNYTRFYINWTRLITTGVGPVVALIYFNSSIFRRIQMTHERTRRQNKQRASEINLAIILLGIVIMFIICHFPRILLNVFEVFMLDDMLFCQEHDIDFSPPVWYLCLTSFNHCLLILNASCNFLIYCSVGAKFKRKMAKVFCNRCGLFSDAGADSPMTLVVQHRTETSANIPQVVEGISKDEIDDLQIMESIVVAEDAI